MNALQRFPIPSQMSLNRTQRELDSKTNGEKITKLEKTQKDENIITEEPGMSKKMLHMQIKNATQSGF